MGWFFGKVGDDKAKVVESKEKTDLYWGGKGKPDGPGHGHLVSEDGVNANYLREPGPTESRSERVVVNDNLPDNAYPN